MFTRGNDTFKTCLRDRRDWYNGSAIRGIITAVSLVSEMILFNCLIKKVTTYIRKKNKELRTVQKERKWIDI